MIISATKAKKVIKEKISKIFDRMNALECVAQDDICSLRIICTLSQQNKYDLEEVDKYGNTALLKACYLGKLEQSRTLIHFGANLRAINYFGQNALTLATHAGHYGLVRELLRHRSYDDFNLSSIIPALCVATLRQHRRLVEFFTQLRGMRETEGGVEIQTVHGLTPDDIQKMFKRDVPKSRNKSLII